MRKKTIGQLALVVLIAFGLLGANNVLGKSKRGVNATKLARSVGPGYSNLAAKWWQYFVGIPADGHPALQPDGEVDCMINQRGKVWFIPSPGPDEVPRHFSCTIKQRNLFFPLLTQLVFNFGPFNDTLAEKRDFLDGVDDAFCGRAWLNGEQTSRTTPSAIIQSVVFTYESGVRGMPDVFGLGPGEIVDTETVAGGYFVLLKPLPEGVHTLRITGGVGCDLDTGEPLFGLDNTYTLTVIGDDDDSDDSSDDDSSED